jgi:hypothetical protein
MVDPFRPAAPLALLDLRFRPYVLGEAVEGEGREE